MTTTFGDIVSGVGAVQTLPVELTRKVPAADVV